jgi:hypothetical protein
MYNTETTILEQRLYAPAYPIPKTGCMWSVEYPELCGRFRHKCHNLPFILIGQM